MVSRRQIVSLGFLWGRWFSFFLHLFTKHGGGFKFLTLSDIGGFQYFTLSDGGGWLGNNWQIFADIIN